MAAPLWDYSVKRREITTMNRRIGLSGACALAALALMGCCAKASDWEIVGECEIPSQVKSHFAGFLDESYFVSVGYGGGISISEDGGKSWEKAENKSLCRYCLDIVDRDLAWCGGNGSNVRVTKDGGRTWQAVTDCRLASTHMSIDFIDATTGWLATTKRLAVTDDGGETWNEIKTPGGMDNIATLAIRSADGGYLLTRSGKLFVTADRGASWSAESIDIAKYKVGNDTIMAADMNFYDATRGEIVFSGNTKNGAKVWILSTIDGGKTWKPKLLPYPENSSATEIFFASSGDYVTVTDMNKKVKLLKKSGR